VIKWLWESGSKKSGSNDSSEAGYERERRFLKKSLEITENWKSVTHTDRNGRPIESIDDFRKGPDGGVDFYVEIDTKDTKSATRLRNRWFKKMQE